MRKAVGVLCLSILALSILARGPGAGGLRQHRRHRGGLVGRRRAERQGHHHRSQPFGQLHDDHHESGFFTQRSLIGGRYQVRIEATGFSAYVQEVSVSVDQETTVDIKLQVGQLSETVEVTEGLHS